MIHGYMQPSCQVIGNYLQLIDTLEQAMQFYDTPHWAVDKTKMAQLFGIVIY